MDVADQVVRWSTALAATGVAAVVASAAERAARQTRRGQPAIPERDARASQPPST